MAKRGHFAGGPAKKKGKFVNMDVQTSNYGEGPDMPATVSP